MSESPGGDDGGPSGPFSRLNVNAPVFVPSFLPPGEQQQQQQNGGGEDGVGVGPSLPPMEAPESWEEMESPEGDEVDCLLGEGEGEEEEGEEGEEAAPRIKKKPLRPEETKSKKEHINVVFIGHVGKSKVDDGRWGRRV
jgi:peptide chain release factor subunit 3